MGVFEEMQWLGATVSSWNVSVQGEEGRAPGSVSLWDPDLGRLPGREARTAATEAGREVCRKRRTGGTPKYPSGENAHQRAYFRG